MPKHTTSTPRRAAQQIPKSPSLSKQVHPSAPSVRPSPPPQRARSVNQPTAGTPGDNPRQPGPPATRNPMRDNTANQRNPNHEQFYKSRGLPGRPADWDAPVGGRTGTQTGR